MSAFNELAKQYATTKIAAKIKAYREGREDIKTDEEAVEDISAQVGPDLSHLLNLGFMYMMQRDERDLNKTIVSIMS